MILNAININKKVKNGSCTRVILDNLNLSISKGEMVAIKGRSGSGKTTLLNILGGNILPDSGHIEFKDNSFERSSLHDLSKYRKEYIGFITQNFNLLDDRNVFENIALPLYYEKLNKSEIKKIVTNTLKKLNMENHINSKIKELSGGEKQRIAIARAIVKSPEIILADEPTGSLDENTESEILNIFESLKSDGVTIIIVTHDEKVARTCDSIYFLKDGNLVREKK